MVQNTRIGLCVPMIFDECYLHEICELNCTPSDCYIHEVYGSLPEDIIGNLRPSYHIKPVTKSNLKEFIQLLHNYNIKFDYIINSSIFPLPQDVNKEEILSFLDSLIELGVDSFTATNPYLIVLIKQNFPKIIVNASICNEISTIHKVKEFEDLDVDCIVLDKDINRDFDLLKKIIKSTNVDLKLLCNSPCLYQCINTQYHANYSSVLSKCSLNTTNIKIHSPFCVLYCAHKHFSNPIEHIKSRWIRPEDLNFYNKLGICFFKLDGRDKPPKYMIEVVKAYYFNFFNGNFLYLLHNRYPKDIMSINLFNTDNVDAEWKIGIDNRSLDNFIDIWSQKKNVCKDGCEKCEICKKYTQYIVINKLWQEHICYSLGCKMNDYL